MKGRQSRITLLVCDNTSRHTALSVTQRDCDGALIIIQMNYEQGLCSSTSVK